MFGFFKKKTENSKKNNDKDDAAMSVSSSKDLSESKFLKPQKRDPERYEEEKKIAHSGDTKSRLSLAKNRKTHQEILYYLAQNDPDPDVRQAVASNAMTPVHASTVLSVDKSEDVRLALAHRLVSLLPELSEDHHSQLYAFVVQSLGTLALDEVIKIRKALSTTLKDHMFTPPQVAGQLARDVEREVAEPILRFCAALSDQDLLDILKDYPAGWAVQAIAGRDVVSEEVSEAVIGTNDRPAGEILIQNEGADISKGLLQKIVEKAKEFPEWQAPVASRKQLPADIAKQLADFADISVRALLVKRKDFDAAATEEIVQVFQRRLSFASEKENSQDADEPVEERIIRLVKEDKLGDEAISDAVAMNDRDFVHAALARMTKSRVELVEKAMAMQSAKVVCAVCWHAGLSMRTALQVQRDFARVHPKEILYPRGGTDYPLSEDEMNWQLEFIGFV